MLNSTSFKTSLMKVFYCGRLIFYIWITFILVYFLFIKDCFEILLLVSYKIKQRFIWVLKELWVYHLWHALLEEAQSKNYKPTIFKSNECNGYMCQSCLSLNESFFGGRTFYLKTPQRKSLRDTTNVRELMSFNEITTSGILNIRNSDGSPDTLNTFSKDKTFASVCCQCEPNSILNNQTLRCVDEQNFSKTINKGKFYESQNIFKEASTSPMKCEDATPEPVKLVNKIYDIDGTNSETKPKSVNLNTPLNSPTCVMPISETPTNELNILPRKSRLELMFSNEDHFSVISPENESLFKRNWTKWKRFSKVDKINFKKKKVIENDQTIAGQTATYRDTSKSDIVEGRNNILINMQTPEVKSCCGSILCSLKTKFNQNAKENFVSYKRF